jgi:23S rRNA (adenine-N6)-dimethyltransferase
MSALPAPDLRHSQNFLKSRQLVDQLLDQSSISAHDLVLEIGPGRGRVTQPLAQRCRQVLAVEKDPRLVQLLRDRLASTPNVTLVEADFLATRLPRQPYKVFANIPFDVTTEIVAKLTTAHRPPDDAYLVLQREAAARFTGQPRGTLWAALLAPDFAPTIVHHFRRTDFDPPPRVDVVMLRLRKRGPPLLAREARRTYRDLVTHCFAAWRPDLVETLTPLFGRARARSLLRAAGLALDVTPGALHPEQWLTLFDACTAHNRQPVLASLANAEARLRGQQRRLQKLHRTRPPPLVRRYSRLTTRR